MRLRSLRFVDLRLGLRPGCYELPSHVEREEVWLLLELLAGALDGVEDVLGCEWSELDGPLELGPTVLLFVAIPEQVEPREISAKLAALPVRFGLYQRAGVGHWPEVAWDEIEVKSALATGLRRWARKSTNPLARIGIAEFPVDSLVESTSEPVELLSLADDTLGYALQRQAAGEAIDWDACARWSIAGRLVRRLLGVDRELRSSVREALARAEDGALDVVQHSREVDELVRVGLAHRHEGDVMLAPLARWANDPQVVEILDLGGVSTPPAAAPKPQQLRARTPSEAILSFDPLVPVMPGDPWFVDLRTIAPELRHFAELFSQQLRRRDRAICLQVLHRFGDGATTMIRALLRELRTEGLSTVDVRLRLHPEFGYVDLLLHTISAILVHCEDSGSPVSEARLDSLRVWLGGLLLSIGVQPRLLLGRKRIGPSGVHSVLTAFERLLESTRWRADIRERLRLALGARRDELLEHLRRTIDDLRGQLLVRGQRLCLHYQGATKLGLRMGDEVFGERGDDLARLDCHIVFAVEFATRHSLSVEARGSTEYHTLSYPSFAESPEIVESIVGAVLAARAELERVFERPDATVARISKVAEFNLHKSLELAKQACELSPAQRLRGLRGMRDWTQADLANRAACSVRTVQRAERGFDISAEALQAIAAALGVEPVDISRPGPASIDGRP